MKINDKHLATFAASSAAVDREGFLNKRGEVNKSFQRRWFVLKGNLLFYYDRKSDVEPVGVIILEGCSVELVENNERFTFELAFLGSGARTYVLAADSQEDMEDWMKALACSGHDYMRCAVIELSRQLDELNAVTRAESAVSDNPSSLAVPTFVSPSQNSVLPQTSLPPARVNPFDHFKESDSIRDSFEGFIVPKNSTGGNLEPVRRGVQTFDTMHFDFGEYIRQRMRECAHSKDLG